MSMGEELTTSPNDVCVLLLVLAVWLWVVFITDILILCPIASTAHSLQRPPRAAGFVKELWSSQ